MDNPTKSERMSTSVGSLSVYGSSGCLYSETKTFNSAKKLDEVGILTCPKWRLAKSIKWELNRWCGELLNLHFNVAVACYW